MKLFHRLYMKGVYHPVNDFVFNHFFHETNENKIVMYSWYRAKIVHSDYKVHESTPIFFLFYFLLEKIKYAFTHKAPEEKGSYTPEYMKGFKYE